MVIMGGGIRDDGIIVRERKDYKGKSAKRGEIFEVMWVDKYDNIKKIMGRYIFSEGVNNPEQKIYDLFKRDKEINIGAKNEYGSSYKIERFIPERVDRKTIKDSEEKSKKIKREELKALRKKVGDLEKEVD